LNSKEEAGVFVALQQPKLDIQYNVAYFFNKINPVAPS